MAGGFGDFWETPLSSDVPTVSAGADTSQSTLAAVSLTGTATAAAGRTIASTAWVLIQTTDAGVVSDQSVLLGDSTALSTNFTPAGYGYSYVATLTATDDLGQTQSDARSVFIDVAYAPSGTIGADASQANLNAITADASSLTGATSWAWTVSVAEDADTSGYTSASAFVDAAAETTTITPDGPGIYTLACAATGPGGTTTFRQVVTVTIAKPVAALVAVSNQNDLAPVALDASATTGTGLVYTWSIRTQPTTSSSTIGAGTPNDDQHKSITLDIGSAGMWRVRVSVADTWGRVSYTERGFRVGDQYGRWRFNPLLSTVLTYDPNTIAVTPVDAGGGVYNYGVNTGAARYAPDNATVYAMALSSVTLATQFRVEVSLDVDAATVDGMTVGVYVGDGYNALANGYGLVTRGTQSTGKIARGAGVGTANPTFVDITCTSLKIVGDFAHYPGDRTGAFYDAVADGAWSVSVSRAWDTSVGAVGTAYVLVVVGATAIANGAVPAEIWIKVLPV